MNAAIPYYIPREPGPWRSLALAVAVHLVLLTFLWIGVRWQSETPVSIEAEVWDMHTRAAAPKELAAITLKTPTPPKTVIAEPRENPDIALAQEKKRLANLAKADEQKKADNAKREKEAEDKEKADKKELDNLNKAKEAAEKKARDKKHADELKRMLGQIGTGGSGDAPKSTGPRSDGYAAIIRNKIKSNITYGGDTDAPGNPRTIFKIEQLPTGEIFSIRKIKSSGIPAFDNAVEKAIAKSSPLPKKKNGTVEREIEATFNLKELP